MATSPTDESVLYELKFTQEFELLAQQEQERIPMHFRQKDCRGSQGAQQIKQAGITNVQLRTARLEPMVATEIPLDARWAYPFNYDETTYWDSFDEIQTMADPKSIFVKDHAAAMNRAKDAECIRAFFETSKTGQTGGSTTAFPSANIIASNFGASADTGLTVAKLRQAKLQLLQAEVDLDAEQMWCVIGATQNDNLYAEAQVVSSDYNTEKPLFMNGIVKSVLGINFIHSEQLPMDSTNTYSLVPVFTDRAMAFGVWMDTQVKITPAYWMRGVPWQIYINAAFGATRLQEKKVIQIKCTGH